MDDIWYYSGDQSIDVIFIDLSLIFILKDWLYSISMFKLVFQIYKELYMLTDKS